MASVDPAEITALLAVPPDEFVAARTARVKELKAEGEKEAGAALAKVRKPVRLVWIVGELARRHPDVAASAAAVAEELEEAQAGGGGVRPLLKRFRAVVGQVAGLADEIEGTVDALEVGLALREVLADAPAREAWIDGRLLALPGDEEDDAPADELAPRRAKRAATKAAAAAKDDGATARKVATARKAAEAAEAAVAAREEARRAASEAMDEAAEELERATASRAEAATALAALEDELAALEEQVAEARSTVDRAEAAVTDAEASHAKAERALVDLD